MKRSLSSRQNLLLASQGLALVFVVGGAVRCSSTSGNIVEPDDDAGGTSSSGTSSGTSSSGTSSSGTSSGTSSSGTSSSGTSSGTSSSGVGSTSGGVSDASLTEEASADGGCQSMNMATLGAHITMPVSWPASAASSAGSGTVNIWLLSNQTGDLTFTGNSQSCGTTLPDIDLNTLGAAAVCAPGKTCGTKVQIQILNSTWDKIKRTFPLTGSQTSWNIGSTLTTNPALGLLGLGQSTSYAMPGTAWPQVTGCPNNCTPAGSFMMSDLVDDDMDGKPGITSNPLSNATYSLPPTTISLFNIPPLADEVYIVSRNQIALTGMRMNSCTDGSGSATVSLFDNHVVGCHIASPAGACTSDQVSFLDDNRTIYGPQPVPNSCANPCIASTATPITGTVKVKQLAANATCADVRTLLP